MPNTVTVSHNNIDMTFTEEDHSYIDSTGKKYISVTTLIAKGFEEFNSVEIAKLKAERDGSDWHELVKKWNEIGNKAAKAGTRLHQNCENQILGKNNLLHEPLDFDEKINFELAKNAVEKILKDSKNIIFNPEKLVFSNKLGIAGSIDLLVKRNDDSYIIYDWKNVKEIKMNGFNNKKGIIWPTKNIQDSNFWHYALQLQIYELILKAENYIPKNSNVRRILNTFSNHIFKQYELPYIMDDAKNLIKWKCVNLK